MPFTVLDLFSGAGGMSEGFLQAGFLVPYAVDSSKDAATTYIHRHEQLGYQSNFYSGCIQNLLLNNDILDFTNGQKIHVITGGPPCQGFSTSGRRREDDFRNLLFMDFLHAVKLVQPDYFVIENVEGMLSYKFKKILGLDGEEYTNATAPEVIQKEAMKFGYFVKWQLLNAKFFDVPQNRPRVIYLGHKIFTNGSKIIDSVVPPRFPTRSNTLVTVGDAISDLRFLRTGESSENYDNRYKLTSYQSKMKNGCTPSANGTPLRSINLTNHEASRHTTKVIQRFDLLNPGESIKDLLKRLPPNERENFSTKKLRCSRLSKDDVAPTVVTLPDDIVHYDLRNPRILTVRELARIQSFDDSFEFLGKRTTGGKLRSIEAPQYTQVGNAVPPLFAKAIATEVMEALTKTYLNDLYMHG